MKDTDDISIKSQSINYNSEEKKWGQKNFRGQIWGQAKIWVEAKTEARPGQWRQAPELAWPMGPGQVL